MPFRAAATEAETVFKGATLLVADVSRGNVGQLAVDLLVATLQMQCVGYFEDPDVLPAVGASYFPSQLWRVRALQDVRARTTKPRSSCSPVVRIFRSRPHPAPRSSTDLLKDQRAAGIEDGKLRVNTELFTTADASLFVLQHRSLMPSAPAHLEAMRPCSPPLVRNRPPELAQIRG